MIYTVYYTKKNPFMNFKNASSIITQDKDKNIVSTKINKKTAVPGSFQIYTVKNKKGRLQIDLNQKELDELVKELNWYDTKGELITTAPLNNSAASFWVHPKCSIKIENDGMTLNDENPIERFWLACFRLDKNFHFKGDKISPSIKSRVRYTVVKLGEAVNENINKSEEGIDAMSILINADLKTKVMYLRAMGVTVEDDFNKSDKTASESFDKTVTSILYGKITEFKDDLVSGERNIDLFLRLAKDKSNNTQLTAFVKLARDKGVVFKNRAGKYLFGEITLGTSVQKCVEFLSDEKNKDILEEISEKIDTK